ncbi:MAG: hypothetical protein JJ971_11375 [Balneolaceae bacterium]|nr:hypothetical protein [Balneolaceae bacterium]MBO6546150.1 hypothetical protein [Balneolaceae bacterium]MBO6648508.1 hypothetical protein [Balneolaceae bacterium]
MKSFLTVFGSFLFSVFVEGFIRVIIIFYHKGEFSIFGISSLPGVSWAIIILVSILIVSWLSGMLTITITGFAPVKHLLSLAVLFMLWRATEIINIYSSDPLWYLILSVIVSSGGLYLAYLTQKSNVKAS